MAVQQNRQDWFPPEVNDLDPNVQFVMRNIYRTLNSHDRAIINVNNKIPAAATTTTSSSTTSTTTSTSTIVGLGTVNNQTGATSYTTQNSDDGALIVFSASGAIAVTLNTGVTTPWFTFMENQGVGTVTLTPSSGTINGSGSLTVLSGYQAIVFFDGINFFAMTLPIVPVNTAQIAHQWFAAYNAVTGTFLQTQPCASDLCNSTVGSGPVVLADGPTLVMPILGAASATTLALTGAITATSATTGSASALPALPAGYLQMSINGTNYKIPYYNV